MTIETQRKDFITQNGSLPAGGLLIINADDWGRDRQRTDRILDCVGQVSAVSAMVYMADSERASRLALQQEMDVGLHLNFTTPFSAANAPKELLDHQRKVARHLLRHRLAQTMFHPGLVSSFDFVVGAQLAEFYRLYGTSPTRIDGHHHMHLGANVILQGLLPRGALVRRNFSFEPGERSIFNRGYRIAVDHFLARRYRLVDRFFALPPVQDLGRLRRIIKLATQLVVEVEVHPIEREEYGSLQSLVMDPILAPIASRDAVRAWARGTPKPASQRG